MFDVFAIICAKKDRKNEQIHLADSKYSQTQIVGIKCNQQCIDKTTKQLKKHHSVNLKSKLFIHLQNIFYLTHIVSVYVQNMCFLRNPFPDNFVLHRTYSSKCLT